MTFDNKCKKEDESLVELIQFLKVPKRSRKEFTGCKSIRWMFQQKCIFAIKLGLPTLRSEFDLALAGGDCNSGGIN
jgi:hypothetical protein